MEREQVSLFICQPSCEHSHNHLPTGGEGVGRPAVMVTMLAAHEVLSLSWSEALSPFVPHGHDVFQEVDLIYAVT